MDIPLEILRQENSRLRVRKSRIFTEILESAPEGADSIEAGSGITYSRRWYLDPREKGIRLTYIQQMRPTESILRNAKESDLFICEGMYGEDDKDKACGYKHMTFLRRPFWARDARVKEMW